MDKHLSHATPALAPHLVCAGAAEAIEFYGRAFGATEMIRMPGPDGKIMHACVAINGAPVMLVDENKQWGALSPKSLGGTPVTIHLNVADVDKTTSQAIAAGATVVMPVADMFWGDRYGIVEDPFGHRWSIATQQRKLSESELREAAKKAFEKTPA
jgi:PhnB protein